jgi:hypothetical protein
MAIFHLSAKVISRGKAQSAIAAAAYRSGDRLRDEQDGTQKYYASRDERIVFTDIMAPKDAPEWAHDRNALWNEAERAERRKDAQLAREIEVSLPHELTDRQREWLIKDFARETFVRKGYAVDIAIHAPDKTSDDRNHHAHLMVTMRTLDADGFAAKKDPDMNRREQLGGWREKWAHLANRHLERHGHEARIDHRSLKEQGADREPTVHLGYAANEMAQRGAQSDRMDELRDILARNEIRLDIKAIERELKALERAEAKQQREAAAEAETQRLAAERAGRAAPPAPIEAINAAHAMAEDERSRAEALKQLSAAARADAAKLRDPEPWQHPVERAYGDSAREGAQQVRQEMREERAQKRQDDWRKDVAARDPGKPTPIRDALKVMDDATGKVSSLGDFMVNLMASVDPLPAASAAKDDIKAFVTDPAARKQQQLARLAEMRQAERAAQAMENIREDVEAGRNLRSSDIKALTHQHQEQIRSKGDDYVRSMVDDARRTAERYWKGDSRERERD